MLLSLYCSPLAQMTAPGSVQFLSGRELKKGHNRGIREWREPRSYISPFSGLLRDWVTRVHYCLPELPWSLGLCPHIELKMAFFVTKQQGYSSFVSKNTTHSLTQNMIYQECGMLYKLYNCLDFMASTVCNGDKHREAGISRRHSGLQYTVISWL